MNLKLFIPCVLLTHTAIATEEDSCFKSTILSPTPFIGNNGETIKLSNGSMWLVKNAHEFFYEYYPHVTVCPDEGYLLVKDKKVEVTSMQ